MKVILLTKSLQILEGHAKFSKVLFDKETRNLGELRKRLGKRWSVEKQLRLGRMYRVHYGCFLQLR